MSLSHGLLGLLNYTDMTGYELAKTFNDSLCFFWQAQTSQIYRELNKLEKQGLLSSRIQLQTDKPNKRIYSITEAGKAQLKQWLESAMPDEMAPTRSEVLLRLFFSAQRSTEENIAALKHIVASYQKQISALRETAGVIDQYKAVARSEKDLLYWTFTADFGLAHSEMVVAWAEKCIKRLEESKSCTFSF